MSIKTVLKAKFSLLSQRNKRKIFSASIGVAGVGALMGRGAAEINTTAILDVLSSMGVIFPALGDVVVALVPTIFILAIVGFVTGFFDKILGMVDKMIK
jgi:hypothetical protein